METFGAVFFLFGVPLLALLYGLCVYISDRRQAGAQPRKTDYLYLRARYPRGDAVFFTDNSGFTDNGGFPGFGFSDGGSGMCAGGSDGGGGGGGGGACAGGS